MLYSFSLFEMLSGAKNLQVWHINLLFSRLYFIAHQPIKALPLKFFNLPLTYHFLKQAKLTGQLFEDYNGQTFELKFFLSVFVLEPPEPSSIEPKPIDHFSRYSFSFYKAIVMV